MFRKQKESAEHFTVPQMRIIHLLSQIATRHHKPGVPVFTHLGLSPAQFLFD